VNGEGDGEVSYMPQPRGGGKACAEVAITGAMSLESMIKAKIKSCVHPKFVYPKVHKNPHAGSCSVTRT
jgi:hypothetical protein